MRLSTAAISNLLLLPRPSSAFVASPTFGRFRRNNKHSRHHMTASSSNTWTGPPILIGGDFCGLSATFDLDGKLIPVPENLVPESLLEWGQGKCSRE